MKNTLSLLFLIASISASAQYKHFTAGAFATTHDFESGNFYSTPGVSFQYNFKRVFSIHAAFSQEKMKRSSLTFNDLNGDYYNSNLELTYLNIPISCRASFGRKFLMYIEGGINHHSKYNIHNTGYIYNNYDDETENEYYTQDYAPEYSGSTAFFAGVGAVIPIAKGFCLELNASKRLFLEPESENENYVYYDESFMYTRGFVQFKYSAGIVYNFNIMKESKYTFSTYKLGIEKNERNEN